MLKASLFHTGGANHQLSRRDETADVVDKTIQN